MTGPLDGLRALEFGGIGPGPLAGMMLADLGAEVIRIDRRPAPGTVPPIPPLAVPADPAGRGKESVWLDLKSDDGAAAALALIAGADILIEGFRPGVMERLGLGPEPALAANPGLVYARITGWGQDGPLAPRAGHDINYIALTGALHAMGTPDARPHPPLNLLGDYAGGTCLLVIGILAALQSRTATGSGQVVDGAMIDGAALLTTVQRGLRAQGAEAGPPGTNVLDGGYPFYATYTCADGQHVALGCLEEPFFRAFLDVAGLSQADFADRWNPGNWPAHRARLAALFLTRSRDDWAARAEDTDACLTPVLSFEEAEGHPHNVARGGYPSIGGARQPAPAPRFSAKPCPIPRPAPAAGADTEAVLRSLAATSGGAPPDDG